jgi:hypothetical protein
MKEQQRLEEANNGQVAPWRLWGPYLSERQWGTVREDYSPNGTAWDYFSHDQARSRAHRWGEDGIAGFSDDHQRLCLALALWNGKDPILKERLFGLTNSEGNDGEDSKEVYYYLDATPTHAYLKMLYKYPQSAFPYTWLVEENRRRSKLDPEFELIDTDAFHEDRYFDVFVEYAKAAPEDILMQIKICNRGPEAALIHVLPQLWFRNTWSWGYKAARPSLQALPDGTILVKHSELGDYTLYADGTPSFLFCRNGRFCQPQIPAHCLAIDPQLARNPSLRPSAIGQVVNRCLQTHFEDIGHAPLNRFPSDPTEQFCFP